MPVLSWAQRRTGRALGSDAVVADSTQTLLCSYVSAVLLVGLVLNATLGWGWADRIARLVIAAVAVREGVEAWRGEGCCASGRPAADPPEPVRGADRMSRRTPGAGVRTTPPAGSRRGTAVPGTAVRRPRPVPTTGTFGDDPATELPAGALCAACCPA
jgi:hypothetical protein